MSIIACKVEIIGRFRGVGSFNALLDEVAAGKRKCAPPPAFFCIPTIPPASLPAHTRAGNVRVFTLKSPKGFGPATSKKKQTSSPKKMGTNREEEEDEEVEEELVPEVVTDRMMKRVGFTVGIPLVIGILFFPFYYYLKAVLKVDIPEWLPLTSSSITFGTAGLGITYGIVSTSWDPLREGSFLGWKEAQANWPVFWETAQGKRGKK